MLSQNIYFNRYRKVASAYTGENIENYLVKFYRENPESFNERQSTVSYLNYTKSVVESIITPIFSEEIYREKLNDLTELFLTDVDLKTSSIDDMMLEAMIQYKLQGNAFLLINNFEGVESNSLLETLNDRTIPYITLKTMPELYQYEVDDYGRLIAIEFINTPIETNGGLYDYDITAQQAIVGAHEIGYPSQTQIEIIGYTADKIYSYYTNNPDDITEMVNPFGFLPVITLNANISPYPPFYDFASTNIAIMNQISEGRRNERESSFSILEIVSDLQIKDIELGAMNIIVRPTNANGNSQFLSPPSNVISDVRESAKDLIDMLLKQADLLGATAINSGASVKSGVAYSYEFIGKDFELKHNAKIANENENRLSVYINTIVNMIKWEAEYPEEFMGETHEISEMITILQQVKDLGIEIPNEVVEYIQKSLVKLVEEEDD